MRPSEVFLSHSSRDRDIADRIAAVLRNHGVPVFYSPHEIRGAQQWHDEIGAALKRCDWFLLLLTPDAVLSKWVKLELMYALTHDRYRDRILPLVGRACDFEELSWTLVGIQHIDLTEQFDAGCRRLLQTWGIGMRSDH